MFTCLGYTLQNVNGLEKGFNLITIDGHIFKSYVAKTKHYGLPILVSIWKDCHQLHGWFLFVCLVCCFTFMVNGSGHVGTVSNLNTLFPGKTSKYSASILSPVTDNLLFLKQRKRGRCAGHEGRSHGRLHWKWKRYRQSYRVRCRKI